MLVRQRMTPNPVIIGPQAMLAIAQEYMRVGHFRRLPVVQEGALIGILTDRDVRRHAGSEERTKVQAAMTETPLPTALAAGIDCAVIVTDHGGFDYSDLVSRAPLIVDTRNALKGVAASHIFRL